MKRHVITFGGVPRGALTVSSQCWLICIWHTPVSARLGQV